MTKYLSDKNTHAAINTKLFRKLDQANNALYEVELAKAQMEYQEPIIVGLFILQNAKLRMLERYYNFLNQFLLCKQVRRVKTTLIPCILL